MNLRLRTTAPFPEGGIIMNGKRAQNNIDTHDKSTK